MEVAIGVIGLSLQLIDSAVKIKGVIGIYRSASTEVNRLALKVELVEAICSTITKSFDQDDSNCQSPELFGTLGVRLLGSIQCTLDELHGIVTRLGKKASKERALQSVGVSFLSKRDDISRLSKCLDEDLRHLQLLLTTDLVSRRLLVRQAETQLAFSTSSPNSTSLSSGVEVESSTKLVMVTSVKKTYGQIVRVFGFHGQSQAVTTTKRSRLGDSQEATTTSERRSFTFGHESMSYRVEIDFQWTPLNSISYALNIQHVVSPKVNGVLYKQMHQLMFKGNLSRLQELLSTAEINLSSSIGRMSLFELAMAYLRPNICRFLLEQNPHLCLQYTYPKPAVGGWGYAMPFDACETVGRISGTIDVILSTQASPAAKFRSKAFHLPTQESFFAYYARFRQSFKDEIDQEEFNDACWDAAVYMMHGRESSFTWLDDPQTLKIWIEIFTDLIQRGVNIHRQCYKTLSWAASGDYYPLGTALQWFRESAQCQREVEVMMLRWLRVLQCCGVETEEYVQEELPGLQKRYDEWHSPPTWWPRKAKTKTISGLKVPTWRRWVAPTHRAYEAAHLFRNFGSFDLRLAFPAEYWDLTPSDLSHILWKNAPSHSTTEYDWPFTYFAARDMKKEDLVRFWVPEHLSAEERQRMLDTFERAQELMQERLERRQLRKLYKSGYLRREKHALKIPGAWTD